MAWAIWWRGWDSISSLGWAGVFSAGIKQNRRLLRELPADSKNIIDKIKQGRIRIEFEHKGLEPMLRTHDRISNRVVYGIVLSSLIIGSSLIVLSGVPPKWHQIPVIGIIGFLAAGAMGFWLLISIMRHGKM